MFIDYYSVLEIEETAAGEEIKAAFRKQAIRWHPDRNPGVDTTIQMQRVNEAYLILKDPEARQKFDAEFHRFKVYQETQRRAQTVYQQEERRQHQQRQYTHQSDNGKTRETKTEYADYTFFDETLKSWMNNARKQSVSMAQQTIKDFKGMVAVGFKEGVKATGNALIGQIVISIIVLIIFGLAKSCHQ